jgi:hypothetical protein
MKKIFANIILMVISSLVMLGSAELVIRFLKRNETSAISTKWLEKYYGERICLIPPPIRKKGSSRIMDPFIGDRFVPFGTIKVSTSNYSLDITLDDLGFRSNTDNFKGNEELLWFLGDSHTFGMVQNLEDTFAKVVEIRLNELSGEIRFRALIHGAVGWGTVNINRLSYKLKPSIKYRMAILNFCVSNDVINNLYYKDRPVSQPAVPDTSNISRIMDEMGFPFLYRQSYLARFIWNRLPVDYFKRYRIMVRKESLERTQRELDRLLEVVGEGNLVVVIIPLLSQITDSWVARWCRLNEINQAVVSWCKENSVPCLDLIEYIKGHAEYYYPNDNHYTPKGNQEVGEIITNFLVQNTGILN